MKSPMRLSFVMSLWSASAIAAGTLAYGAYQYMKTPGASAGSILADRLWYMAALAALVSFLCWIIFDRKVLLPLKEIYLHLYDIGAGRLTPLSVRSNVEEIRSIVDVMNNMVRRLEGGCDWQIVVRFRENLESLRDVARAIAPQSPERAAEILDDIAVLERTFFTAVRSGANVPALS